VDECKPLAEGAAEDAEWEAAAAKAEDALTMLLSH